MDIVVITQAPATQTRPATLAQVLLRRRGAVYPGPVADRPNPAVQAGVQLLEADLLDRGWLLSPALRDALLHADGADLVGLGATLIADCDALLGADRHHLPLFRRFPDRVPADTAAFFVDRILAAWFQAPDQPCVLCTESGAVTPVNPCGHLVCQSCFDPADFSACPICHRRLDADDPYLRSAAPPPNTRRQAPTAPQRLRVLHLGTDEFGDARAELIALLGRPGALPPADADDLATLLTAEDRADVSWLPARVPGRETKARVLAWLLADPAPPTAADVAAALIDTATDVLRLLVARSGGGSLIDRPRLAPVPRPLRRVLLGLLDRIGPVQFAEDMRRHRRAWIAAGERLHPGEYAGRYPATALAFAAIRATDIYAHPAGRFLAGHAAHLNHVGVRDGRVTIAGRGRRVEESLAAGDTDAALAMLRARPGELLRRADHLLRLAISVEGLDAVLAALAAAAGQVSPAVLLSALGEIRTRAVPQRRRVFFPAGRTATAHVVADERPALPAGLVDDTVRILEGEVLRRAAALPAVDRAVIDTDLDGLVAPFAERTAARALLTLARGSLLPIPAGRYLRLFCHWMEDAERVDLDLSVAVYDEQWNHVGTCDFTSLRLPGAVHSGDLTSAPAPQGATEFVDLDAEELAAAGGRYAVVTVLSYNNVPFTNMAEAFAGFMLRAGAGGEAFDARTVEQRFDLTGPGKVTIPFVVDLRERTMQWLDVNARVTGTDHAVHRHHDQLGTVAGALTETFAAGGRVTLGELGRLLVAARASEVLVRGGAGIVAYRRRVDESAADFAARLRSDDADGEATADDASTAAVQLLVRGDLPTPAGAQVYALHPGTLDASAVQLLAASDVAGMLPAIT